ncbi:unnamed protein product [Rotaria sordida]|uniref:G-protein coupled receptors family 1 profile domain-containing protein n=1 Tax=Rotaria sordida TaxID=392033 RepID=A0A814YFF7_9BILA|nr:unnamed protein product [Rotaria sordida]
MSNTTSDLVQKLNIATYWIDQIYPLLQIAFGTFGNVFNIIIFSRRALRSNPCSLYFLVGSIDNCVVIGIGICSRYLASSWYWDPSATNIVLLLITTLISTPYFALAIYNAIAVVMFRNKLSPSALAIYNFAQDLSRLLHYTNPVITFYIYTLTGPKFRVEMKRCIQHGLKSVLTAIGLMRCLPLRAQQALLGENQVTNTNNISLPQSRRRGNAVHPTQQKATMSMTPVA